MKSLQNSTENEILPCSSFHQREPHMRRPSSTWLGLLSSSCHSSETSIFKSLLFRGIPRKVFNLRWQDTGHWGLGPQLEAGLEPSCWDMIGIRSGAPLESSYSAGCPYTCHCRLPREETTISADLTWHAIWRWVQHWFLLLQFTSFLSLRMLWKIW